MSEFSSRWDKPKPESLGTRIRHSFRPPEPMRPRIEEATRQIQVQISKLDMTSTKLREKDASIFSRVVQLVQKHDTQHANMLANELAELRKISKMVTTAKLALEQITLRLTTIKDMGDIATILSPAMGVLNGVRSGISKVVPEAEGEISEISGLLSGIFVEAGQMSPSEIHIETANEEADKVLEQAAAIAEQGLKEKFSDLAEREDDPFSKEAEAT